MRSRWSPSTSTFARPTSVGLDPYTRVTFDADSVSGVDQDERPDPEADQLLCGRGSSASRADDSDGEEGDRGLDPGSEGANVPVEQFEVLGLRCVEVAAEAPVFADDGEAVDRTVDRSGDGTGECERAVAVADDEVPVLS